MASRNKTNRVASTVAYSTEKQKQSGVITDDFSCSFQRYTCRHRDEHVMALTVSQVYFEHHTGTTALGIGETTPRISWRFGGNSPNWTQSSYSVEVNREGQSQPELFNISSSDSVLLPWPSVSLSSAEEASVRVQAHGQDGQPATPWSDIFTVETGLLTKDDWAGAVIIASDKTVNVNQPKQPILLRKEFPARSTVTSARLYITAYGIYEAYINGKRVGDAVLAPGWQSYTHRLVYDTHDVTDLISTGTNAIGIHAGEGWYSGRLGYNGGNRNIYGDTIGAIALLSVTYENGTKDLFPTDLSWESGFGAVITSEIYDGEKYDARLEQAGWSKAGFKTENATAWTGVKVLESPFDVLAAPDGPPIRRSEEVQLVKVLTSPSGKTILDFGQNLVGWLRLKVAGPEGTTIKLIHTEVLEHGEVATRPLRNATQTDYITLSNNGFLTWEPTFTYHGFRYVEVTGWPTDETPLDENAVTAIVVHSSMDKTGYFECSDALLNKLHENVEWSMKGNFMSIPTDCPQRDERLGWTGDAHAFSPTANFLYDTSGFWKSWIKDVYSEQKDANGSVPVVIPGIPVTGTEATAIWGDVIVANPWNAYTTFGDLEVLKEQYPAAKLWLEKGIPRDSSTNLWNRSSFQYGDWLDPLAPADSPGAATTDKILVADAYLVWATGVVAQMASELGLEDDVTYHAHQATKLKAAFNTAWIDSDGLVANETQTGLTLPLYFDIFPNESQTTAAVNRLQNIIADKNYLVGTGFAGTHLLGLTLTKYDLTETFYKMILQTTVPSWLYQVVMNATTTWERWDSLLPDGSLNPGQMTSFNHYAFGSVANWVHQVIGGLAPAEPGWKTVKVSPIPGGNVTSAKASYLSPYGMVSTDWNIVGGVFKLVVEVPPNSKAEVTLPGVKDTKTVGSGTHEFTVADYPETNPQTSAAALHPIRAKA